MVNYDEQEVTKSNGPFVLFQITHKNRSYPFTMNAVYFQSILENITS
jgi:hypothetical protein